MTVGADIKEQSYKYQVIAPSIKPISSSLLSTDIMETPNVPIGFVPAKEGEVLVLAGGVVCRIQETGSRTGEHVRDRNDAQHLPLTPDNRIGAAEFTVPPNTMGPPPHWHEMVRLTGTLRTRERH